ncbi:Prolyl 4-hydroxylase, alpha subunit [Phytophthora cactorum]|nr:Prolyl 4-hydroxylase, alpha subunit [Phytophthora cactorum]
MGSKSETSAEEPSAPWDSWRGGSCSSGCGPSELRQLVSTYAGVSFDSNGVDCTLAEQYLTDALPVKGFHVLCIQKDSEEVLDITAFKDGNAPPIKIQSKNALADLKTQLEKTCKKYKQPYAFFTPKGARLERLGDLVNQIVFFFEGGQFIWPGIRIGHKTVVKDVAGKGDVVLETLSLIPLVFSVEEFLKDDEIDVIMDLSLEHLKPSTVTLMDGHENRAATDWRTSTTYFLSSSKHPKLDEIDERVADLTKVPIDHQEDVQVLRYEETQKYDHHTDYFPVEHHKNSPHVLESIDYGYKNRMITVFWYMSDVAKGGHTIFPRAGGAPRPQSMKDCTKGLKVPPKKRKVIVFYSMLPNGEGDPMSLHGGCPVEDGIKYSGNKWVWNKARN